MAAALEGIRVVDLTMWFQGPVAGQHLADFGAEVIHFESPKGGDFGRGVRSIKALPVGDWNQYFDVINRNKKSMAVDLNKPEGKEIMHKLVAESDVFLTNLSSRALEKWDVGYERLREINPKLIYAMGSGYGPHGRITKPSFDLTVQALIGVMNRLGEPGQPPIYLGMGSGDAMGGLMAAFGIMLALYARQASGKGQFLDASLYGAQLFMAAPTFQGYLATLSNDFREQRSRKDAVNPLWNTYEAADGWLVLCLPNDESAWARLTSTFGADLLADHGLLGDPRFVDSASRRSNASALVETLGSVLATRPAKDWLEAWKAEGIPASSVENFADLLADSGTWENGYFLKAHSDEVNREVDVRGLPVSLSKTPGSVRNLGPALGQDTEMILFEALGYDWERIGEFKSGGVIL